MTYMTFNTIEASQLGPNISKMHRVILILMSLESLLYLRKKAFEKLSMENICLTYKSGGLIVRRWKNKEPLLRKSYPGNISFI